MELRLYRTVCLGDGGNTSFSTAFIYCSVASSLFVGSLYLVVPANVRKLDRDHSLQIKWRSGATILVCFASLAAFPVVFGSVEKYNVDLSELIVDQIRSCAGVLMNTVLLFTGPITVNIATVYERLRRDNSLTPSKFVQTYYNVYIRGLVNSLFRTRDEHDDRWIRFRDLVVAPVVEEILFRGCIVSALALTPMGTTRIVVFAPFFFGSAHFHHALLKMQQVGARPMAVLVQTAFQFAYTSLFGSYATYAYLQTRSILPVVLSHSFCNSMGLPDLRFLRANDPLYNHRKLLLAAHVVGIFAFASSFNLILPAKHVN